MSALTPFDITADLPTGTVLLEASAGTGKTWTIGALVARHIAAGTPLEEMLVITFGRAASKEMRERVREHLRLRRIDVENGLRLLGRGIDATLDPSTASLLDVLLDGSPHRVSELSGDHAHDLVRRLVLATVLVKG